MRPITSDEKKEAHRILNLVKVGWDVDDMTVMWCLLVLGDATDLKDFDYA